MVDKSVQTSWCGSTICFCLVFWGVGGGGASFSSEDLNYRDLPLFIVIWLSARRGQGICVSYGGILISMCMETSNWSSMVGWHSAQE